MQYIPFGDPFEGYARTLGRDGSGPLELNGSVVCLPAVSQHFLDRAPLSAAWEAQHISCFCL